MSDKKQWSTSRDRCDVDSLPSERGDDDTPLAANDTEPHQSELLVVNSS